MIHLADGEAFDIAGPWRIARHSDGGLYVLGQQALIAVNDWREGVRVIGLMTSIRADRVLPCPDCARPMVLMPNGCKCDPAPFGFYPYEAALLAEEKPAKRRQDHLCRHQRGKIPPLPAVCRHCDKPTTTPQDDTDSTA